MSTLMEDDISASPTMQAKMVTPVVAQVDAAERTERRQACVQRLNVLLKDSALETAKVAAQGMPMAAVLKKVASAVADFDFDSTLAVLQREGGPNVRV